MCGCSYPEDGPGGCGAEVGEESREKKRRREEKLMCGCQRQCKNEGEGKERER